MGLSQGGGVHLAGVPPVGADASAGVLEVSEPSAPNLLPLLLGEDSLDMEGLEEGHGPMAMSKVAVPYGGAPPAVKVEVDSEAEAESAGTRPEDGAATAAISSGNMRAETMGLYMGKLLLHVVCCFDYFFIITCA